MVGPVFWIELKTVARRDRHFAVRVLFVLSVFGIVTLARLSFQPRATPGYVGFLQPSQFPQLGQFIFTNYSLSQLVLVLILAPLYSAGAVSSDRERGVLDLIFMSLLRNRELISGKLAVRIFQLCGLVVAGVPVMCICLLLGGVGPESLLATFLLTVTMVFFICNFGLLISTITRRTFTAIIMTYILLLIVWLAMPALAVFLLVNGSGGLIAEAIVTLNPGLALMSVLSTAVGAVPGMAAQPHWACIGVYGSGGAALLVVNLLFVRVFGLWASRPPVQRAKSTRRQRATRSVWSNPVAWREVKTVATHQRMRWVRLAVLVFLLTISSIVWIGWLVDWFSGRGALDIDRDGIYSLVPVTATLAWSLAAILGGVSFAHEQEHGTLEVLLTTPLTSSYIVVGKLAGILRSTMFALVFPVLIIGLGLFRGIISPRAALLSLVIVLSFSFFAAVLGLFCSVRTGSSLKSVGVALAMVLFIAVGVPAMDFGFLDYFQQHYFVRFRIASPFTGLTWSLDDERFTGEHHWMSASWIERFDAQGAYICGYLLLACIGTAWSIWTVDRSYRAATRLWGIGLTPSPSDSSHILRRKLPSNGSKTKLTRVAWWSLGFVTVLAATTPLLYLWWLSAARKGLERVLARLPAGEPRYFADLDPGAIPPADDGSTIYAHALSRLETANWYKLSRQNRHPDAGSAELLLLERNRRAVDLVSEAVRRPAYSPPIEFGSNRPFEIILDDVQDMRSLGWLLHIDMMHSLDLNDIECAFDALRDNLLLGELFRDHPFLVTHLVRYYSGRYALKSTCAFLGQVYLTDRQYRELDKLLAAKEASALLRKAVLAERAVLMTGMDRFSNLIYQMNREDVVGLRSWLTCSSLGEPLLLREMTYTLRYLTELANHIDRVGKAGDDAFSEVRQRHLSQKDRYPVTQFATERIPSSRATVMNYRRAIILARLALRVDRYHELHHSYPKRLDELCDDQLPRIPTGLFNKPILLDGDRSGFTLRTEEATSENTDLPWYEVDPPRIEVNYR